MIRYRKKVICHDQRNKYEQNQQEFTLLFQVSATVFIDDFRNIQHRFMSTNFLDIEKEIQANSKGN